MSCHKNGHPNDVVQRHPIHLGDSPQTVKIKAVQPHRAILFFTSPTSDPVPKSGVSDRCRSSATLVPDWKEEEFRAVDDMLATALQYLGHTSQVSIPVARIVESANSRSLPPYRRGFSPLPRRELLSPRTSPVAANEKREESSCSLPPEPLAAPTPTPRTVGSTSDSRSIAEFRSNQRIQLCVQKLQWDQQQRVEPRPRMTFSNIPGKDFLELQHRHINEVDKNRGGMMSPSPFRPGTYTL